MGAKHGFQGTINAKNLRENRFSSSDGGLACSDGGCSPLALPWPTPDVMWQMSLDSSFTCISAYPNILRDICRVAQIHSSFTTLTTENSIQSLCTRDKNSFNVLMIASSSSRTYRQTNVILHSWLSANRKSGT